MKSLRACIGLAVLMAAGPGGAAFGEEREPAPPKVAAADEAAVRRVLGKTATVTGTVTGSFASEKGVTFLDLEGGKFTVVCWQDNYGKFRDGSPEKQFRNRHIEITGEVIKYRSGSRPPKLEIILSDPGQVKITPAPGGGKPGGDRKSADGPKADDRKTPEKPEKKPEAKPGAKPDAAPDKKPETKPEAKPEANPDDGKKKEEAKPGRVDPKKYFR